MAPRPSSLVEGEVSAPNFWLLDLFTERLRLNEEEKIYSKERLEQAAKEMSESTGGIVV